MSIFNTRNEHINYILNKINENREENLNCDCLIINGDQIIPCHEIILRLASPVFITLIENAKRNSYLEKLSIDISSLTRPSDQLENILHFIYTGKIEISDENIFEIIHLATALEIDLVQFCCKTIMDLLDISNINNILQIAHLLEHDHLTKMCISFLNLEFYNMENFLHILQEDDLKKVIMNQDLVLWNSETNRFFVGFNYTLELERLVNKVLDGNPFLSENLFTEDFRLCLKRTLQEMKIPQQMSKFITDKRFSIPSGYTAPVKRLLPFGMHPLQLHKITTLCSKTVFNTIEDCSPNLWKIRKIVFYLVPKWNNMCSIIAGVDISYQKIWNENEIKTNKCQLINSEKYDRKEMSLSPSENIIKIRISHSWVIHSLLFETDKGNLFGPFGDPDPPQYEVQITNIDICNLNSEYLYLHGFHYINIMSFEWQVWNQVSIECAVFDVSRLKINFSDIFDHLCKRIKLNNIVEYFDDMKPPKSTSLLNTRPLTFLNMENNIY